MGKPSGRFELFEGHHAKILDHGGRGASAMLRVFEVAKQEAVVGIPELVKRTATTHPTISQAVRKLVDLGVLFEVTGRARDRRFLYRDYVRVLSGTP